ncbi:MAG: YecA family protein [Calditrichota bacterium]
MKLGRNDPCWCGSGLKYKKCHLGRSTDVPPTIQEAIEAHKDCFQVRYCVHPHAKEGLCKGSIVKAHTIQRGGGLSRIAKSGYVYSFLSNLVDSIRALEETANIPNLIHINKASTFTGFCQYHDHTTFEPLENSGFSVCDEHVFLLTYRALCYEYFAKKAVRRFSDFLKTLDKGSNEAFQVAWQKRQTNYKKGILKAEEELDSLKVQFDKCLLNRDFKSIRYCVIHVDTTPDILCSGLMQPEFDFDGKILQDYANLEIDLDHIAVSIIPDNSGGKIVFSWLADLPTPPLLIDSILKEGRIADAIIRFCFLYFENTYARPSWWDSLSKDCKDELLRKFGLVPGHRLSDCLKDDHRRYVEWNVQRIDKKFKNS